MITGSVQAEHRRVVVTGAGGFVGRHLVPVLQAAGHDVAVVVRPGASGALPRGVAPLEDTGDPADMARAMSAWQPSACVHLATRFTNGTSAEDLAALLDANVAFGMRVAHAFAQAGGDCFVYTSSFSQRRGGEGYAPTNLYAATKQAFGDILRFYSDAGSFRVVDLQLYDTIGTGDTRPKIWGALMRAAWTETPLATSEGGQLMSPTHVDDVVRALLTAMRTPRDGAASWTEHYAAGPELLTLRGVVDVFARSIGHDVPVGWGARPYSGNEMFSLWTNGTPLPGWDPRVSLEAAFRQMWEEFLLQQQPSTTAGAPAVVVPAVVGGLQRS